MAVLSVPVVLLKSALNDHWPCCVAGCVAEERSIPLAVLSPPVVLLKSAADPLAVLSLPVVLL